MDVEKIFGEAFPQLLVNGEKVAQTIEFIRAVFIQRLTREDGALIDQGIICTILLFDPKRRELYAYGAGHDDPQYPGRVFARVCLKDWSGFLDVLKTHFRYNTPLFPDREYPKMFATPGQFKGLDSWTYAKCAVICSPERSFRLFNESDPDVHCDHAK